MPCYDPRDTEDDLKRHQTNIQNAKLVVELADKNAKLEGILCAVFNELERNDILYSIVSDAQRKGKIDILTYIEEHFYADKIRLANDIQKRYSVDELNVIKNLLNENKRI